MKAYRSLGNEVRDRDKFAGVSIDESLNPSASFIILDLNDMCQNSRIVVLDQELEGRGMVIELSIERLLGRSDSLLESDGGV